MNLKREISVSELEALEDGVLISPGHAAIGANRVRALLWREFGLCGDAEKQRFRETVCMLIRFHSKPLHFLSDEDPALRVRRIAHGGTLAGDFSLHLLCLLAEADVLGRQCADRQSLIEGVKLAAMHAEESGCLHSPYPFASPCTAHAYLAGRNVWPDQDLFDASWGEVILMCGLPGTGKDTWIHKNHPDMPIVSLDDIRRRLSILPTDDQGKVLATAYEDARQLLRSHTPFIWNATSLIPAFRGKEIRLFEDYGASVRIVWLETQWEENLRRNRDRRHAVPEIVINEMLDRFIPPDAHEARHVDWLFT